jgi:uncharacterized protein YbcI
MDAHGGRVAAKREYPLRGKILSGISNSMVRLYREHFGKGPTGAKTYLLDPSPT